MSYSYPPEQVRGEYEQCRNQWQKNVDHALFAVKQIQQRVILDKRIWNEEGSDPKKLFPIDLQWIFPVFPRSICEYVHKFQTFRSKKTKSSINQEHCCK